MNFFKCGDRVQIKRHTPILNYFPMGGEAVVVGYATLQSGVPCLVLSMDTPARAINFPKGNEWAPRELTNTLVVPMADVEPLS